MCLENIDKAIDKYNEIQTACKDLRSHLFQMDHKDGIFVRPYNDRSDEILKICKNQIDILSKKNNL